MTVKFWESKTGLYEITYTEGTNTPIVGEILNIVGVAADTCIVQAWTITSGSWSNDNAAGKIWVYGCSATFITNLANAADLENAGDSKICNCTSAVALVTGNWQVAGNWGEGEAVSVPVANDIVIFDGRSVIDVTDGYSQGETGGVSLDLLHMRSLYSGNIGTSTIDDQLHINPDKVIFEGTGTMYLECSAANATTAEVDIDLVILNGTGDVHLSSNTNTVDYACAFTEIVVNKIGSLYITDHTIITTLRIKPQSNNPSYATVDIGHGCQRLKATAAAMIIYMENGTLTCDSPILLMEQRAGTVYFGDDGSVLTGMDVANLILYGGTFYFRPDDAGAYIVAKIYGGNLNLTSSINSDRSLVLGNGAGLDVIVYPSGVLDLRRGGSPITIAASSQLINLGGTVYTDNNTELGLTNNPLW